MDLKHQVFNDDIRHVKPVVLLDENSNEKKVFCLLCKGVYKEPYIASCGHTFCKDCLTEGETTICPSDGMKLKLLVNNLLVEEEVSELMIHCCYGCEPKEDASGRFVVDAQGCPAIIKLGEREQHEQKCGFGPSVCPNSSLCPPILRKHLPEHLKKCGHLHCKNYICGCQFEGTQEELNVHQEICQFRGLEGSVMKLEGDCALVSKQIVDHTAQLLHISSTLNEDKAQIEEIRKSLKSCNQRTRNLEEQQVVILKDLTSIKNSVSSVLNELKSVQAQLKISACVETQHLFKCNGTFVGHKGPVWALSRSDNLLFSASSDNTIKAWNLSETYSGPKTLTGHDGIVLALCCQGDIIFSGSSDTLIKVWNVKSLTEVASFQAHCDPVCTLACNESFMFSGSLRSIKVWNMFTYDLTISLPTQNHWVRALVVHGKMLYSGSYKAINIWNTETFEVAHVLQCTGGSVYSLAVTDKHIICGTYENSIHVWDVKSHSKVGTLNGHVGSVYGLALLNTPGRVRLFSGSYDKTIRVWNLELMTCAQTLARHEGSVTCLLTFRGAVFSAAVDSTLKVWH